MSSPKYPNQQLRSVNLEAHFPGELGVYGALGEVQAAVRGELPNVFVPNLQAGEAVALRPFQMRDVKQRRSLAVALNQVTYTAFSYPGYEVFSAEALPIISATLGSIRPEKLTRVTYRYENEVGIARDADGWLQLDPTFPGIVPKIFSGAPVRTINSVAEHRWQESELQGARGFHARVEEDRGVSVLKLTVFASVEPVGTTALKDAADAAHRVSNELFETIISQEFREFISTSRE